MQHQSESAALTNNTQRMDTNAENLHRNNRNKRNHNKKGQNQFQKIDLKYIDPKFKFDNEFIEILFFKKIQKDQIQDVITHMSDIGNRKQAAEKIRKFFESQNNLNDAARLSHQIIEDLAIKCQPELPKIIIFTFLKILITKNKKLQKDLKRKSGQLLLKTIPLCYFVEIIELYELKLTKKDAESYFIELSESKSFAQIPRFMKITGYKFENQIIPLLQRYVREKKYKQLKQIPNYKDLFANNNVLRRQQQHMMVNAANYHFKADGWSYLEQIYEFHPTVIAIIINRYATHKQKQQILQAFVSICQRIPLVFKDLKGQAQRVIKDVKNQMIKNNRPFLQNQLRSFQFGPSLKDHFSFQQFQVTSKDIIWIDHHINAQVLNEIKHQILSCSYIGVDTQSTVARTALDGDIDVLALIQVATDKKIYLFDVYRTNPQIRTIFAQYFSSKTNKIIGHTIKQDVNGIISFFKLSKYQCHVIDVCDQYKIYKNNMKQCGLKHISKEILGKEICKKYTMTNWQRRPLNACQIHYAAMDAFIVLKIWEKLEILIKEIPKIKPTTQLSQTQQQTNAGQQLVENDQQPIENDQYNDQKDEQQTQNVEIQDISI